jgi:hypothetical protein
VNGRSGTQPPAQLMQAINNYGVQADKIDRAWPDFASFYAEDRIIHTVSTSNQGEREAMWFIKNCAHMTSHVYRYMYIETIFVENLAPNSVGRRMFSDCLEFPPRFVTPQVSWEP